MNFTKTILLLVAVLFSLGCRESHPTSLGKVEYKFIELSWAYDEGVLAYREEIPSNANPYTGTEISSSRAWLRGWIDAKQFYREIESKNER
jgi:hypothetical protein